MRHEISVRIYFEDTDFTGVVYHANFLRFFERGRSDALRAAGFHHRDLLERDEPLAFTVHGMNIRFLKPARIDDLLTVATTLTSARGARMTFVQETFRDDECLARADVTVACMDLSGRPRRLPADVLAACPPTPISE